MKRARSQTHSLASAFSLPPRGHPINVCDAVCRLDSPRKRFGTGSKACLYQLSTSHGGSRIAAVSRCAIQRGAGGRWRAISQQINIGGQHFCKISNSQGGQKGARIPCRKEQAYFFTRQSFLHAPKCRRFSACLGQKSLYFNFDARERRFIEKKTFTAMTSLGEKIIKSAKFETLQTFCFLFRTGISLKVDVIQSQKICSLQGCPCTFSPEILQGGAVKGLTSMPVRAGASNMYDIHNKNIFIQMTLWIRQSVTESKSPAERKVVPSSFASFL